MKPNKFWAAIFRFVCVIGIVGMTALSGGTTAQAEPAAPTITVSCAVTPLAVEPGKTAVLSVSVENVPVAASKMEGMNAYDISLSWTADGLLTFSEPVPQLGPAPWDTTSWNPAEFNLINNDAGTLRSARMKGTPQETFSGTGVLFSAPFTLNREGSTEFKFTAADIPFKLSEDYVVTFRNCSVTSLEIGPAPLLIFLPYVKG